MLRTTPHPWLPGHVRRATLLACMATALVAISGCERGEVGDTPVSRCYPEGQCDEAMFKRGVTAALGDAKAGALVFKARCATCHGDDGKGKPPDTLRIDFTSVVWHAKWRDGEIAQVITGGRPPKMPAQSMSPKDLRDTVAYLRSLKPAAKPTPTSEKSY